jgi:hypothetical protein
MLLTSQKAKQKLFEGVSEIGKEQRGDSPAQQAFGISLS